MLFKNDKRHGIPGFSVVQPGFSDFQDFTPPAIADEARYVIVYRWGAVRRTAPMSWGHTLKAVHNIINGDPDSFPAIHSVRQVA